MTPRLQRILGWVIAAVGVMVIALGTRTTVHHRQLAERGVEITAKLISIQHRRSDSQTGHQVQYRFEIAGRSYEHVGIFGPVPTDISAEPLARAQTTGEVEVRYLPDDPSVNQIVDHVDPPGGRGPIAIGIGLLLLFGGAVRIVLARRSRDVPGAPG